MPDECCPPGMRRSDHIVRKGEMGEEEVAYHIEEEYRSCAEHMRTTSTSTRIDLTLLLLDMTHMTQVH